jgi:microsomal dipeptidase-like Zn-dependent dipeptidase
LEEIRRQVQASHGVQIASAPKDLFNNKMLNRKSIMLGIENGYAIGKDLSNIERYRREGVVYMTLCHNGDNDICDSASRSNREHGGLSEFGRQVVAEMNRVGMMIDLSHASEETFYQTLELSTRPVICSHSSARALCNHPRNLTDDQVRALAEKGGVVQATFYEGFLVESGEATIDDAVRHIMHLINMAGIDHVGIGSDFDGDGGVRGLQTAADYLTLTRRLMAEGLNERSLRKLWGGNFVRVMSRAQYNTLFQYGDAEQ